MAVVRSFDVDGGVWREESSFGNLVSLCASWTFFYPLAQILAKDFAIGFLFISRGCLFRGYFS